MKSFNGIRFKGTFRDYQQSVLDNIDSHLSDSKIHIVAAPGSGKTVLGLELVRRLNQTALILSPTVTIRQQWGERFGDMFLSKQENLHEYMSFHLGELKLMTAVTYQSLHAAWTRSIQNGCCETDDADEECEAEDYTGFDVVAAVRSAGIRTICLDEAHHLRSEWQKSLEAFLAAVQHDVIIISLTATPPYDSPPNEWNRYISVCGEIDEEISVPELVKQRTLCPHQDYICFNFPSDEELDALQEYQVRASHCVDNVLGSGLLAQMVEKSALLSRYPQMEEFLLENVKGTIALLVLIQYAGISLPQKLIALVSPSGRLPIATLSFAETAFQLVLDHPEVFSQEAVDALKKRLSEESLLYNKRVCLASNERLKRRLISSAGKLSSIARIARAESNALNEQLRMVILTDHIKKDLLHIVGTYEEIATIGTVTVFETLRRAVGDVPIGLLSGGLVILPEDALDSVRSLAEKCSIPLSFRPLNDTGYCEITFLGSNKHKVAIVTELFRQGLVRIIVGTAALLGEGWDSPCINSLILASYVGSFVLSNQMRGRAIRIDPCDPAKTSNIWHLCTVEPPPRSLKDRILQAMEGTPNSKDTLHSSDYPTLRRRFECFLAPAYHRDVIESGIRRVDIIQPPFDSSGIARINQQMLALAADRQALADKWARSLSGELHPEVLLVSEAPSSIQPRSFVFINMLWPTILSLAFIALVRAITYTAFGIGSVLGLIVCALMIFGVIKGYRKALRFISPRKTIETLGNCILNTLKDIEAVKSAESVVEVISDSKGVSVQCAIAGASLREKEVFAAAIRELLSPINNPRYILVKKDRLFKRRRYTQCYACPSVIGAKKEFVERLLHHLKRTAGAFELIFTRNETGRAELLKCRRWSYINQNDILIEGKKAVRSCWE